MRSRIQSECESFLTGNIAIFVPRLNCGFFTAQAVGGYVVWLRAVPVCGAALGRTVMSSDRSRKRRDDFDDHEYLVSDLP